ncbi:hypothetical protein [Saccharopolyspora hattusasensis]|uniref:hypothetical protein n=1 Tax=Saccharopolyspora hattusasensis TaxID=1128679 RepID=UPI003D9954B7
MYNGFGRIEGQDRIMSPGMGGGGGMHVSGAMPGLAATPGGGMPEGPGLTIGGPGCGATSHTKVVDDSMAWVANHCTVVAPAEYGGDADAKTHLYDCQSPTRAS